MDGGDPGGLEANGSRSYIQVAVNTCTQASRTTAVASHAFMFSVALKKSPSPRIDFPVGSWTLP